MIFFENVQLLEVFFLRCVIFLLYDMFLALSALYLDRQFVSFLLRGIGFDLPKYKLKMRKI